MELGPKRSPSLESKTERHAADLSVIRSKEDKLQVCRFTSFIIYPDLDTAMPASGCIKQSGRILYSYPRARLPGHSEGRGSELVSQT